MRALHASVVSDRPAAVKLKLVAFAWCIKPAPQHATQAEERSAGSALRSTSHEPCAASSTRSYPLRSPAASAACKPASTRERATPTEALFARHFPTRRAAISYARRADLARPCCSARELNRLMRSCRVSAGSGDAMMRLPCRAIASTAKGVTPPFGREKPMVEAKLGGILEVS